MQVKDYINTLKKSPFPHFSVYIISLNMLSYPQLYTQIVSYIKKPATVNLSISKNRYEGGIFFPEKRHYATLITREIIRPTLSVSLSINSRTRLRRKQSP